MKTKWVIISIIIAILLSVIGYFYFVESDPGMSPPTSQPVSLCDYLEDQCQSTTLNCINAQNECNLINDACNAAQSAYENKLAFCDNDANWSPPAPGFIDERKKCYEEAERLKDRAKEICYWADRFCDQMEITCNIASDICGLQEIFCPIEPVRPAAFNARRSFLK